jgi:glycerol-3-phosphate dehydrogenase (NAD(P)+)
VTRSEPSSDTPHRPAPEPNHDLPWSPPESAAVVGAGAWGTTIANLLAGKGLAVSLWVYEPDLCELMVRMSENVLYLPGIPLAESVRPSSDLAEVVDGQPLVVFVTPSQVLRGVAGRAAESLADEAILVCCSKGIEAESLMLLPEVLDDVLGRRYAQDTAFISGPSFAREVAEGQPTSAAVAARDMRVAEHVQQTFETETFTLYGNPDVTGIELCGAVKNVIAIAVGICDGLGYGFNTRAAVITRGLGEIIKLGTAMGANPLTFSGLAGFGDLVLTCTSDLSRNKSLGRRLGEGEALADILQTVHTVAEGVDTAKSVRNLALKYDLDMPICYQVYRVLHEGAPAQDFVSEVLAQDKRHDVGRVQVT